MILKFIWHTMNEVLLSSKEWSVFWWIKSTNIWMQYQKMCTFKDKENWKPVNLKSGTYFDSGVADDDKDSKLKLVIMWENQNTKRFLQKAALRNCKRQKTSQTEFRIEK